jgi:lipase ATG15
MDMSEDVVLGVYRMGSEYRTKQKRESTPPGPSYLSMSLRLLLFTHLVFVVNALVTQQITFNAHLGLFSDKHNERLEVPNFITSDTHSLTHSDVVLNSRLMTVYRPRSLGALHNARRQSMRYGESPIEPLEWDVKEVLGPDIENRHTLAQLARMSGNAYALPGLPNWYEVDHAWNQASTVYLSTVDLKLFNP